MSHHRGFMNWLKTHERLISWGTVVAVLFGAGVLWGTFRDLPTDVAALKTDVSTIKGQLTILVQRDGAAHGDEKKNAGDVARH